MLKLLSIIREKKEILDAYRPIPEEITNRWNEWAKIELARQLSAMEGGNLSSAESKQLVEKGITTGGKSLKEQLAVVKYAQEADWIRRSAHLKIHDINERLLITLHHFPSAEESASGGFLKYSYQVPYVLTEYIEWLHQQSGNDVEVAIKAFIKLLQTKPFAEGTVSTGYLLFNLLLLQKNYPFALMIESDYRAYRAAVSQVLGGDSGIELTEVLQASILYSLERHIAFLEKKDSNSGSLLKIGELARITNETIPTIRHWTKQGLLKVERYSEGGYQLYQPAMADVVLKIREFQQNQRMSIKEIQQALGTLV